MATRTLDLVYRTMIAELGQRSFDASFQADFSLAGRFVTVPVKGRDYFYFEEPTGEGKDKRTYVGPAADPEIAARVAAFQEIKDDAKARRKLVSTLIRSAGLQAPDPFAGNVIEALANGGFFRLRGVLIGTSAFQCYSALLGVRLPSTAMQTGDADFAQDFAISAEVDDTMPSIVDLLKSVDSTFRPIPHRSGSPKTTAFENAARFRVEFLTGNRGSDEYTDRPADMPALGGAAADPLRFLDFLIYEPVRSILLHKSGVTVTVPAPERYAVHKLIIASRRVTDALGGSKRDKDIVQAVQLILALMDTGRANDLADAFQEAWFRGSGWQEAIKATYGISAGKEKAALAAYFREIDLFPV
ncbi:hypothetical protein ELG97_37175 [Rhizobium leguminosarum]|uniref:nucleotidyltransferase family protein n=1 Tax=Rhizobium leguminosarum TaxID=384 RepID=UPI001031A958|nr:GSU2403 family nucleotidyltransferase fold protein [Rhizobium leguminosarum]TBE73864.1 hypothetical protein ELG97_37175 [Rhizobium leguminosarum]